MDDEKNNSLPLNQVHVGSMIADRLHRIGMAKAEFANRINISRQNIHGILRRESIDVKRLIQIGQVLEHDFLQDLIALCPVPGSKPPEESGLFVLLPVTLEEREYLMRIGRVKGGKTP